MKAAAILRRRSVRAGLLGTMLIVATWVRSAGRVEVVEWTSGSGTWWAAGCYDGSLLLVPPAEPALPTGSPELRVFSEAAEISPYPEDSLLPPAVHLVGAGPLGPRILIAWWFVLILHLAAWAGFVAWRRRSRGPAPPLASGEDVA